MKKTLPYIVLFSIVLSVYFTFSSGFAYAQSSTTLLPQTKEKETDCLNTLKDIEDLNKFPIEGKADNTDIGKWFGEQTQKFRNDVLACAIKTGKIHFWMIPHFIVYFIEFMIGIAGLIAILFIVIGGYQLVISGATDQKDNAKNTIKHALMGLVLVLVAWVVVNVVQYILTI